MCTVHVKQLQVYDMGHCSQRLPPPVVNTCLTLTTQFASVSHFQHRVSAGFFFFWKMSSSTSTIQSDQPFLHWTTNSGQREALSRKIREDVVKIRVAAQSSRARATFHQSAVHSFSFATTTDQQVKGSLTSHHFAVKSNCNPLFRTRDGETATFEEVLNQESNKVWHLVNETDSQPEPANIESTTSTDNNVIASSAVESQTSFSLSNLWMRCFPCVKSSEE